MSLTEQLQTLEGVSLIRLAAAQPDLAYIFRHTLVREATYASLVRADRQRLHLLVGNCLERLLGDLAASPEQAAALAWHFDQAGDRRALRYAVAAAEAAASRYANREAVTYYDLALAWAQRDPAASIEQLQSCFVARGRVLELSGDHEAALANYRELNQLGRERGDAGMSLRALVLEGTLRSTVTPLFNIPEGHRLAAEGLAQAQALHDTWAEARIHWNRLNLLRFSGDPHGARASGEQGLALARASGDLELTTQILNDLAHVYGMAGAWPEHKAAVAEASQGWRQLGNLPMLADSLSTAALYASVRGNYAVARDTAREAFDLSHRIGNLWGQAYSLTGLGYVLWLRADYAAAIEQNLECLRLAAEGGYMAAQTLNRSLQAHLLADLDQLDEAGQQAQQALDWAEARLPAMRGVALGSLANHRLAAGALIEAWDLVKGVNIDSMRRVLWLAEPVQRVRAEIAVALALPEALNLSLERLGTLRELGVHPFIAEALETLSRAQRQAGQPEAARASLLEARKICEQLGTRRALWRVLRGLAALGETPAASAALEAESRRVVDSIVAELPDPAWRAGFLRRVEAWR